jgi:hypothetical protein
VTAGQPGRRCSVTVLSTKMAGAGVSLTRGACEDEDSSDGQDGLVEGQFDLGGNDRRDGFLRGQRCPPARCAPRAPPPWGAHQDSPQCPEVPADLEPLGW